MDALFVPTSLRTAIAIRNACLDEDISERRVEALVAAEPGTAAAILRLANSPLHYRGTHCTSLWSAMMLLGHQTVRHIAAQTAMMQLVHGLRSEVLRQAAEELHHHAIVVAAIAESIGFAKGRGRSEVEATAAFALMHELPAFLWLARTDQLGTHIAGPQALSQMAESITHVSIERTFMDLGLPEFASVDFATRATLADAHCQAWVVNPLFHEDTTARPGAWLLDDDALKATERRVGNLLRVIGVHARQGDSVEGAGTDELPHDALWLASADNAPATRSTVDATAARSGGRSIAGMLLAIAISVLVCAAVLAWWAG